MNHFPLPAVETKTTEKNNSLIADNCCPVVTGHVENRKKWSEPTASCTIKTEQGGEKFRGFGFDRPDRTPERIAKAQAFWERQQAMRKDPARCPRCGGQRGEEFRTCDRCRANVRKLKLRAKGIAVVKGGEYSNADLAAMVIQMRREMDKLQARFKLWQKAAHYRRDLHYRTNTMRKKYLSQASEISNDQAMEYLQQTNHAYENPD